MNPSRFHRIEETLALDPQDRYALAELMAFENPCVAASQIQPGQRIHHQRTSGGSGIYEVVSIRTVFGGTLLFRCSGFSEQGTVIHPSVTYKPEEKVEVVK